MTALWIFLGGGLGSLARWWCSGFVAQRFGETFPLGTLVVNVTGSFVIGFIATLTGPDGRWLAPVSARQFIMVGLCGGFTTFSAFSLQTLDLARGGQWFHAALNALLSFALCMAAVWLGHVAALALNSSRG